MTNRTILAIAAACLFAPAALPSSLQDWQFNVNGNSYYPAKGSTFASVPGLDASAFNSTTGQGTLTFTFDPKAAGTYFIGAYFFNPVGVPFYNEYGATSGTASGGQSWQIDVPQYDVLSSNHGPGTIVDNLSGEKLDDLNHIPGGTSNYLFDCGANTSGGAADPTCNDWVSVALGFKFTLTSTQTETVRFTVSSTPGSDGISLEALHPVDGSNAAAADYFLSGVATTGHIPPPPTTPEPATWGLLALGTVGLLLRARNARRTSLQPSTPRDCHQEATHE